MDNEEIKLNWNKNAVIEFKNDRIALVQRKMGDQVEFIAAFDYLTSQGYKLMANESFPAKWSGRNITYFYFQKLSSD